MCVGTVVQESKSLYTASRLYEMIFDEVESVLRYIEVLQDREMTIDILVHKNCKYRTFTDNLALC